MVPWLWRGPRQLQQKWDTTSTYPGSRALTLEPSSRKHQSYSAWNSVKCLLPFLLPERKTLPSYSNTEIPSYANMSGPAGHWQSLRGTRLQELLMKGVFWSGQQPKAVSYCNISVQIDGQHLARGQGEGKGKVLAHLGGTGRAERGDCNTATASTPFLPQNTAHLDCQKVPDQFYFPHQEIQVQWIAQKPESFPRNRLSSKSCCSQWVPWFTGHFQGKEKGFLHAQSPAAWRMPVGWEWLITHRDWGSGLSHPPSTALRRLLPSADTPRDAFKSEIIVPKYISYTAPNCLPWQVSFCQHKGYAVSHSCHSTHNNTSGEMPLDKDRLLLPSNVKLGLFFSGMLKTFQTQQIKFLTNMMWNKNNKTTQRTPEL